MTVINTQTLFHHLLDILGKTVPRMHVGLLSLLSLPTFLITSYFINDSS